MSWNGGAWGANTVSERAAAIREQRAEEAERAAQLRSVNEMTEKSPTGIPRATLRADQAKERFGDVHRKLGEAWDLLREGRQRTEEANKATASRRSSDASRAPALTSPRNVR